MSAKNASVTFVQRYAVVIREQTVGPLDFLARVLVHVPEQSYVTTRYSARIVACILQGSVIARSSRTSARHLARGARLRGGSRRRPPSAAREVGDHTLCSTESNRNSYPLGVRSVI